MGAYLGRRDKRGRAPKLFPPSCPALSPRCCRLSQEGLISAFAFSTGCSWMWILQGGFWGRRDALCWDLLVSLICSASSLMLCFRFYACFNLLFPLTRPQERLLWLIDLMEVGAVSETGSSSAAVAIVDGLRVRANARRVGGRVQAVQGPACDSAT